MYIPNPLHLLEKEEEKDKPKRKIIIKEDMDMKEEPTEEQKREIIRRRLKKYGA